MTPAERNLLLALAHDASFGMPGSNQVFQALRALSKDAAAPVGEPAAMPPEMPEIQVGDWVVHYGSSVDIASRIYLDAQAIYWNKSKPGLVLEVRGERNGVAFIWRRTNRKGQTA